MPIVLTTPLPGEPTGPGFRFNGSTTSVPQFPVDARWELTIFDVDTEFIACVGRVKFTTQSFQLIAGDDDRGQGQIGGAVPSFREGQNAFVSIHLVDGNNQIVDSYAAVHPMDMTTGIPHIANKQATTTVQGGFTETDRQQLQVVEQSVQVAFPQNLSGVANFVGNLSTLFTNPPPRLLTRTTHVQLSGSGTLTLPELGIPVNAYGATWQWFTVPPNYGKHLGNTVEYIERLAQFSLIKTDRGGNQYVDEVVDSHYDGIYWIWGLPLPEYILYTIAPGVVVDWVWLKMQIVTPP